MAGVRVTGSALYMNSDIYTQYTYGTDYPEETEYFRPWSGALASGLGATSGDRQQVGGRVGYYYTWAYPSVNHYYWIPHYFGMRDEGSAHWLWHSFSFLKADTGAVRLSLMIFSVNSEGFPGTAVTNSYTSASTSSTGQIAVSTLPNDLMKPGWYYVRAKFVDTGSRVACYYRSNGAGGQSNATMWNTLDATPAATSSIYQNQCYQAVDGGSINVPNTRSHIYPMINIRTGIDSNVEEGGSGTYNTGVNY